MGPKGGWRTYKRTAKLRRRPTRIRRRKKALGPTRSTSTLVHVPLSRSKSGKSIGGYFRRRKAARR